MDYGKLNQPCKIITGIIAAASTVVLSAWKNIRGLQELNKATCPVHERRPHAFDLRFTEFSSVVIYLRYALVAFKISSPHYNYKSLLITNVKLGITCQIFLTSILDRLRSVLNKSTIIFWWGICVVRTNTKQHCMTSWIPNSFIKINFS